MAINQSWRNRGKGPPNWQRWLWPTQTMQSHNNINHQIHLVGPRSHPSTFQIWNFTVLIWDCTCTHYTLYSGHLVIFPYFLHPLVADTPDLLICGNCKEMFSCITDIINHKKHYCKLRFACKCSSKNGFNGLDSLTVGTFAILSRTHLWDSFNFFHFVIDRKVWNSNWKYEYTKWDDIETMPYVGPQMKGSLDYTKLILFFTFRSTDQ